MSGAPRMCAHVFDTHLKINISHFVRRSAARIKSHANTPQRDFYSYRKISFCSNRYSDAGVRCRTGVRECASASCEFIPRIREVFLFHVGRTINGDGAGSSFEIKLQTNSNDYFTRCCARLFYYVRRVIKNRLNIADYCASLLCIVLMFVQCMK